MKEKLLLLLLREFINDHKKPRKNIIRKFILLRKRFLYAQSLKILNYQSLILKLKERFGAFTDNNFGFNICGTTETSLP